MYLQCYICLLSLANSFQNTKLSLSNSPPPLSVPVSSCLFCSSSSDSNSNSDEEEESMSEGEMAQLMEEVEEKKKLIATIRNKPWRMKRRLTHLK